MGDQPRPNSWSLTNASQSSPTGAWGPQQQQQRPRIYYICAQSLQDLGGNGGDQQSRHPGQIPPAQMSYNLYPFYSTAWPGTAPSVSTYPAATYSPTSGAYYIGRPDNFAPPLSNAPPTSIPVSTYAQQRQILPSTTNGQPPVTQSPVTLGSVVTYESDEAQANTSDQQNIPSDALLKLEEEQLQAAIRESRQLERHQPFHSTQSPQISSVNPGPSETRHFYHSPAQQQQQSLPNIAVDSSSSSLDPLCVICTARQAVCQHPCVAGGARVCASCFSEIHLAEEEQKTRNR